MRVIGISPLDKDATVSFMEDGRICFACAEERLSRVKLQDGFPHRALMLGLERLGWEPESVDTVAYAFFDGQEEGRLMRQAFAADGRAHKSTCTADSLNRLKRIASNGYEPDLSVPIAGFDSRADEFMPAKPWLKRTVYDLAAALPRLDWRLHRHFFRQWIKLNAADHLRRTRQLNEGLAQYALEGKLRRFNHHDTHAANALYASGFDQALLVTLDGYGSGNCGGVYEGRGGVIAPLHKYRYPNSLGQYYEMVTSGLGFQPSRHEGKIVGLAAYGDPTVLGPVLRDRFDVRDGDIRIRGSSNYFFTRALAERFAKRDVAAAYQDVLEQVAQEAIAYWVHKTGMKNVAVSGGVNANVKLNQRIAEIEGVEQVFVYPNMGDGGCGSGAAMLAFDPQVCAQQPLDHAYLGPDYSDAQLEAALRNEGLTFDRPAPIEQRVAELLCDNHIVARFNGRLEYGPRALGNRSILYPAQDPKVNLWLNGQLGRTEFMPFAPAALADHADRLFKNVAGCEKTAQFMTITFDCTDEMVRSCPAAVHVDKTARPQLVSGQTNASFHQIIQGYYERTGIAAIINTSFNMHEEPIVCTPGDAIRAFLEGNVDYLAIGPFLCPHPRLHEIDVQRRSVS